MTTALCALGVVLIVVAVSLVYVPAGFIVAGGLLLTIGWALDKESSGGDS